MVNLGTKPGKVNIVKLRTRSLLWTMPSYPLHPDARGCDFLRDVALHWEQKMFTVSVHISLPHVNHVPIQEMKN